MRLITFLLLLISFTASAQYGSFASKQAVELQDSINAQRIDMENTKAELQLLLNSTNPETYDDYIGDANVNNLPYPPNGVGYKMSGNSATRQIRGIAAPTGTQSNIIHFLNTDDDNVWRFQNEHANATDVNRIKTPNGSLADCRLNVTFGLRYDTIDQRWYIFSIGDR